MGFRRLGPIVVSLLCASVVVAASQSARAASAPRGAVGIHLSDLRSGYRTVVAHYLSVNDYAARYYGVSAQAFHKHGLGSAFEATFQQGDQEHVVLEQLERYATTAGAHWGYCLAAGQQANGNPGCRIPYQLNHPVAIGQESAAVFVPESPGLVGDVFREGTYVVAVYISLKRYSAVPPLARLIDQRIRRSG